LGPDTASLAQGCEVAVIFVNDIANEASLRKVSWVLDNFEYLNFGWYAHMKINIIVVA